MIRVSELLKSTVNDLDRVVIMDHGLLYSFNKKTMPELAQYARRGVKSFYIEITYIEHEKKLKQTIFIELKGEPKNERENNAGTDQDL